MTTRTFQSFDRTRSASSFVSIPSAAEELAHHVRTPMIARGGGMSYSDAGFVDAGHVFDMRAMDRLLEFDDVQGSVIVEPGVSVGALQSTLAPRGWLLPVVPGYPAITVGGCIGFNVHGKGQARDGTFCDWVEALTVWHPSYGYAECSRFQRPDLFSLTIGGLGLTGVIVRATLRLRALKGDRVRQRRVPVRHVTEAARIIRDEGEEVDYAYSWNNLNLRGPDFGAGVVFLESAVPGLTGGVPRGYRDRLGGRRLPSPLPPPDIFVRLTCRAFQWWQHHAAPEHELTLHDAMFPIVGREPYFRQFGAAGFREYQTLVPWKRWPEAAEAIERAIVESRAVASLGSLKVFRGVRHHLSLCGEGVCFSLDVRNDDRSLKLFSLLDDVVLRCGGIVNLSKDSRADAAFVRQAFPEYESFRGALRAYDPDRRFASNLSRRIGL